MSDKLQDEVDVVKSPSVLGLHKKILTGSLQQSIQRSRINWAHMIKKGAAPDVTRRFQMADAEDINNCSSFHS